MCLYLNGDSRLSRCSGFCSSMATALNSPIPTSSAGPQPTRVTAAHASPASVTAACDLHRGAAAPASHPPLERGPPSLVVLPIAGGLLAAPQPPEDAARLNDYDLVLVEDAGLLT